MNLKLVVASMSILGLVSCPVFAATTTKHKHHRTVHQAVITQPVVEHADYKGMDTLPPAPDVCIISHPSMILDGMTQSMNRSMPNPCNPGWFDRIRVSGGVNVDLGKFGNTDMAFMGENYQRFSLNDAYLNIGATINDWTKVFTSIDFGTPTTIPDGFFPPSGEYSAAYSNNIQSTSASNNVQVEQAYLTVSNFDATPLFLQVGKQFQDFGRYEIHPIERSMTQVLSETLATSAKLGFIVPMGFNGSIFAFDDPVAKIGKTSKTTNYGIALGYDAPSDALGWDVGVAYLYNLIGVNDVAFAVQNYTSNEGYNSRTGGVAAYFDINSGPFIVNLRYVTAVQRFNVLDIPKNGVADVTSAPFGIPTISSTATGAKPWAAGIQAGYGFGAWNRNNNIYIGYQTSREAAGINLPKNRWLAGYGVDAFGKNTTLGLEWDHDSDYSASNGGGSGGSNLVTLRVGAKFG